MGSEVDISFLLGDLGVLEGRFWEIGQLDDVVDRGFARLRG